MFLGFIVGFVPVLYLFRFHIVSYIVYYELYFSIFIFLSSCIFTKCQIHLKCCSSILTSNCPIPSYSRTIFTASSVFSWYSLLHSDISFQMLVFYLPVLCEHPKINIGLKIILYVFSFVLFVISFFMMVLFNVWQNFLALYTLSVFLSFSCIYKILGITSGLYYFSF